MASNYLSPLNTKLDANQVLRRAYDEPNNRLRVDAQVTATIGTVEVVIDAASGDNIAISDGTHTLNINPDGSIDVNVNVSHTSDSIRLGNGTSFITSTTIGPNVTLDVNPITKGEIVNTYNSVSSVASSVLTTVVTKTITQPSTLKLCSASGENIGKFEVVLNGSVIASKRSYFSDLNVDFNFDNLELAISDVVLIRVLHTRPSVGDFEGNIIINEGI